MRAQELLNIHRTNPFLASERFHIKEKNERLLPFDQSQNSNLKGLIKFILSVVYFVALSLAIIMLFM